MAFEIKDFFMSYGKRGVPHGTFNLARADVEDDGLMFVAQMNDEGSYIIQRITTSGTLMISSYYAKAVSPGTLSTDWSNRASLTYGEFSELFQA